MKKLKITAIALYALCIGACAYLKIVGLVSWYVALAPIWFPLAVAFSLALLLMLVSNLLVRWAKREESKNPPSCANCIFGKTAKYADEGKCLGEAMDESIARGVMCKYYKKG